MTRNELRRGGSASVELKRSNLDYRCRGMAGEPREPTALPDKRFCTSVSAQRVHSAVDPFVSWPSAKGNLTRAVLCEKSIPSRATSPRTSVALM